MKKTILMIFVTVVAICIFASCKKACVCTVTINGLTIDQVEYDDLTGRECEAQTDIAMQQVMDAYGAPSPFGLQISCSHL